MYEHIALGYRSSKAFCLTKVRSSRARCLATALFMPPTSEEVEGAYWFGSVSVQCNAVQSVCDSVKCESNA